MSPGPIMVEVLGMSMSLPRVRVETGGRVFDFVNDPIARKDVRFNLGAFFSKAVLTDEVFKYPRSSRVAVLMESPIDASYRRIDDVVRRFPIIFTHQRTLIEKGEPFRPLLFGTNWLGVRDSKATDEALNAPVEKRRMTSFIGSLEHPDVGAYRFRREIAEYVVSRGDVECFGKGIRPIAGKLEALAPFRFSIAMENASSDSYFSEKLIDCLLVETIPIYFGCPGIGDVFDVRGMLPFSSRAELHDIIDSLTPELYQRMHVFAVANRRRAVEERLHNHAGLFERLAGQVPDFLLGRTPKVHSGTIGRIFRKYFE